MKKLLLSILISAITGLSYSASISINDFTGGLNTKSSKNRVGMNQCYDCLNVLFDEKPNSIVSRAGYSLVTTTATTKLFEYIKSNGVKHLIKQYRDRLSYSTDEAETWTNIISNLKWELNNLQMTVFDDKAFFTNGVDDVFYFDGYTRGGNYYDTVDSIPVGKYLTTHNNKMFVANTWDNPSFVYYIKDGLDPSLEDNWKLTNFVVAGFQDGDIITGIISYNQMLLIFKKYSIWALVGYSDLDWEMVKINSSYGALYQESIVIDKGTVKFLSHVGYKELDGTFLNDIDYFVEDKFLDSNNLAGEYNYLQLTNYQDFNAGTGVNIDTEFNELKLKEYEVTFNKDDFSGFTTSNVSTYGDGIQLATTVPASVSSRYDIQGIEVEVVVAMENNAQVLKDGSVYYNKTGFATTVDGRTAMALFNSYSKPEHMYDTIATWATTYGEVTVWDYGFPIIGTIETIKSDNVFYYANPVFDFTIPLKEDGILIDKIVFKGEVNIGDTARLEEISGASYIGSKTLMNVEDHIYFYLDTTYWQAGVTAPTTVSLQLAQGDIVGFIYTTPRDLIVSVSKSTVWVGNTLTLINPVPSKKITKVRLRFRITSSTNKAYTGELHKIFYNVSVEPIYDISIYEFTTADKEFENSGYFISGSTRIGGTTTNVEWAKLDISDYTNLSVDGTTITYLTETSVNGSTWEDPVIVSTDGVINSSAGQYIKLHSSFTTTNTDNTPSFYSATISAISNTGSWISAKYNIGQADGGWGASVHDTDANGQTITMRVRYGTSTTDLDYTDFSTISSGDNIGASTSETYIQYGATLTTTDGNSNPTIYSITSIYAPESTPITPVTLSVEDRCLIAISTRAGGTSNDMVMVQDKNKNWTKYSFDMLTATKFGKKNFFSDGTSIYEMDSGTTDSGTAISSQYKKNFNFGTFTFDKWLNYIYTAGQKQTNGQYLNIIYTVENDTTENKTDYDMTGTGRFRHRQPVEESAVQDFDIIYKSTQPIEIHAIDLHYDILPEFSQ